MLHESMLNQAKAVLGKLDDLRDQRRILGQTPSLNWEVQYWGGNALVKIRTNDLPCAELAGVCMKHLQTRIAAVAAELRAMGVEVNDDV